MKKILALLVLTVTLGSVSATAQSSAASQQVQLQLNPAIEIESYSAINLSTAGRQFHVRANKEFNISVSAQNSDNVMLALQDNGTGGVAADSYMAYAPVSASSTGLLSNCAYGNDRSFAVNYKAKNSDAVLLYTATQP